ncbi:MAG: MFS transporter [Desulfuromonadaceae bacterium]|nr:MFS transporter [Desulfuromonadaceae bacterium]
METGKLLHYGRRTVCILFATQSLFSAGYVMLFTVSSILAVRLGGSMVWTGVPITIILAGAALGAWPIGRLMGRHGRRLGLSLGQLCGIAGSLMAGTAILYGMLGLYLVGLFFIGIARGSLDMGRYAAADANPPHLRARAISLVIFGSTVGAFIGPPILKTVSRYELSHGLPAMSLPWFVMAFVLLLSFVLVFGFLRPDPLDIAKHIAANAGSSHQETSNGRTYREIIRERRFILAVISITCGHLVMYLIMTVTPVFMNECHHAITSISWVIVAHMFGMYGLSFAVGWFIDKFGCSAMIVAGCIMLVASCLMAPLSNGVFWLALVLFLVGLGWNCCFVAGSTLLSEMLLPVERGRVQGLVDTLINFAAGAGSLGSGFLYAAMGYNVTLWISLFVSLIPCFIVWRTFQKASRFQPVPLLSED